MVYLASFPLMLFFMFRAPRFFLSQLLFSHLVFLENFLNPLTPLRSSRFICQTSTCFFFHKFPPRITFYHNSPPHHPVPVRLTFFQGPLIFSSATGSHPMTFFTPLFLPQPCPNPSSSDFCSLPLYSTFCLLKLGFCVMIFCLPFILHK